MIAWLLVDCEEDGSIELVPKGAVISHGALKLNERVRYKSVCTKTGKKMMFVGKILDFGEDGERTRLCKVQDNLNKEKKQKENRERKSSVAPGSRRTQIPTPHVSPTRGPKPSNRKRLSSSDVSHLEHPDGAVTEHDDDMGNRNILDSSDTSDLTEEEHRVLLKVQEKKRKRDLNKLSQIRDDKEDSAIEDIGKASFWENVSSSTPRRKHSHVKEVSSPQSRSPGHKRGFNTSGLESLLPTPTRSGFGHHRQRRPVNPAVFEGDMFNCTNYGPEVQMLSPGVPIQNQDLDYAKRTSGSGSALARQLMKAVFTPEALLSCSLGGNYAFGNGKPAEGETRPPLDQRAVNTIFDFSRARLKKKVEQKKWKDMDDSTIKTRMRNLLCEMRYQQRRRVLSRTS